MYIGTSSRDLRNKSLRWQLISINSTVFSWMQCSLTFDPDGSNPVHLPSPSCWYGHGNWRCSSPFLSGAATDVALIKLVLVTLWKKVKWYLKFAFQIVFRPDFRQVQGKSMIPVLISIHFNQRGSIPADSSMSRTGPLPDESASPVTVKSAWPSMGYPGTLSMIRHDTRCKNDQCILHFHQMQINYHNTWYSPLIISMYMRKSENI